MSVFLSYSSIAVRYFRYSYSGSLYSDTAENNCSDRNTDPAEHSPAADNSDKAADSFAGTAVRSSDFDMDCSAEYIRLVYNSPAADTVSGHIADTASARTVSAGSLSVRIVRTADTDSADRSDRTEADMPADTVADMIAGRAAGYSNNYTDTQGTARTELPFRE